MSRRAALAGLGAGSFGFALASQLSGAMAPNREPGTVAGSVSLADHPLTGLWLSMVELPSQPGVELAVPSIFSADGFVVLMFPPADVLESGVQLRGAAVGTWEAVSDRAGHFTVVEVLCDGAGGYLGSVTIDGFPSVNDDRESFEDRSTEGVLTLRDARNSIVGVEKGYSRKSMMGYRMKPGHAGFPEVADDPRGPDPRTEASRQEGLDQG